MPTARATAGSSGKKISRRNSERMVLREPPVVEDSELEWKLCVGAIPIALCFALAFHVFMPFLQRTFLGMPVHELGHALSAWLTGHAAVPTLWKTLIPETRGFVAPLALLGAIGYGMYRAYLSERYFLLLLGGALLLLQAIGTFGIKPKT